MVAESWDDVGRRVAEGRLLAGVTQAQLAARMGLDRTAVTRIETGDRRVDVLELVRLSAGLGLPLEWFLKESPPVLASRRQGRLDTTRQPGVDVLLERLAYDVELVAELGTLQLPSPSPLPFPATPAEAEARAGDVRQLLDVPEGPLTEIGRCAAELGLLVFALLVEAANDFDGAYVALAAGGVAVVSGGAQPGRRRFTAAHELGHHVFGDDYATDLAVGESEGERERLINAFAVHLLMPRQSMVAEWEERGGGARSALLHVAVRYRVSWTAVVAHAANLGLIGRSSVASLHSEGPSRSEMLEAGLWIVPELEPPSIPHVFARAVLSAYRRSLLSAGRVVELLHGAVSDDDLPAVHDVPLDAYAAELHPLE